MPATRRHFFRALTLLFLALCIPSAANATPNVCADGSATFLTIQDAVDAGLGSISICAGVHTESGILIENKGLTVSGQGQGVTIVQAATSVDMATDRVFLVDITGPSNSLPSFQDMTIRHGNPTFDENDLLSSSGGGILVLGDPINSVSNKVVILRRCTITGNVAAAGGGVFASGGVLLVLESTISDNVAALENVEAGFLGGGGIGGFRHLPLLMGSTVSGNMSATLGGGISGFRSLPVIYNSTISGNYARGDETTGAGGGGGGLALLENTTPLPLQSEISNSTISGNSTGGRGGGLFFAEGDLSLLNATFKDNSAELTGGGIFSAEGLIRAGNMIVAGSTGDDCVIDGGALEILGPNLDSDATCPGFSIPAGRTALGPLADNGGPTRTHALRSASDAVDAGDADICANSISGNVDQRGVTRPQGIACDLGSFELDTSPPDCSGAASSIALLWPPNHKLVEVEIEGITDPDGDAVTITIDGIFQDEPVDAAGNGDGNTSPDGQGVDTSTAEVRAERAGSGNGRVYTLLFTAADGRGGTCKGTVNVGVPHDRRTAPIDDGPVYDSTVHRD